MWGADQMDFTYFRFRNLGASTKVSEFIRGYGYQGGGSRSNWSENIGEYKYGRAFNEALIEPGGWSIGMGGFGEFCLIMTIK